ncbi:D-alanyl-D-alanine carboxypeptidase family protein [Leifsonia sp. Root112D2]|uniref:D-alanyl-D-alanine carboxypeptidase family protein n=1 Tax=Leifsonia sp. Root112D2 TaxID=1736426 RepID=UPI000A9AF410|nr:D-alanyl-D-alanine carboxypeptidase [Leifsonia sp. Root112D2]
MQDLTRAMRRRRLYRRRRIVVFSGLAIFLLLAAYVLGTQVASAPTSTLSLVKQTTLTQPAAQLAWPAQGSAAVSAVGYRGTLAVNGSNASVPIASITKTITALVVLDAKPLKTAKDAGPKITFTDADVKIFDEVVAMGGSWATVKAGSTMTERQALEAMLLPSANNYAISLAIWAYGSVDKYVSAANVWLASHKLTSTHVADASGYSEKSVSNPTDLVEIAKLVMANPALPSIVATKKATLPGAGDETNRNSLLGTLGVDGIKTGNTSFAGYCLMFSSTLTLSTHTVHIVGVVIGQRSGSDLFAASKALVKSIRAGFHEVQLTRAGQTFGSYTTRWGTKVPLVARKNTSMLVWSNTPVGVKLSAQPVRAAGAGDAVGAAVFSMGSTTVKQPLTLQHDLAGPDMWWRLTHPSELG